MFIIIRLTEILTLWFAVDDGELFGMLCGALTSNTLRGPEVYASTLVSQFYVRPESCSINLKCSQPVAFLVPL